MNLLKLMVNKLLLVTRNSCATPMLKRLVPRVIRDAAWSSISSQDEFSILGSRMYIPPDSRSRDTVLDQYEPGVSACLEKLLKPGMTFCDVGANFGIFTLFASKIVGSKGKVFAFEPVEANRKVLERNIKRNHAQNITVFKEAVSESGGTARIFLSRDAGCHSLSAMPTNFDGRSIDVSVVRLDQVKEIEEIGVLKIDVEGAEIEVLKGLGNLKVDHVILEYNSEMIVRRGMNGIQFIDQIKECGFNDLINIDDQSIGLENIIAGDDITVNLLLSRAMSSGNASPR